MATDTRTAKGSTPARYDAFVAGQLAKAESRIRAFDLATGLLGLLAATLVFAVLMAAIDSQWTLSPAVRQTVLGLYLVGAGVHLYRMVYLPLRRRINPYYAARKVEATVPGAKNSVINWVDLHDQKLAPAIRSAVGQRAARDLGRADIDRAISGRRAGWAGGLAGAALAAFLIAFFVLGRSPFFSCLNRTFAPFGTVGPATRTQLEMVQPEGGNAVVTVDRPMTLVARVGGKLPDPRGPEAVRLRYRYEEGEPYQERLLQPESATEWGTTLSAADVRNGFWYHVAGGDARTDEYRVAVRAPAALTEFLATYHFRPYVARIDEVNHERDLEALRGTEVLLWARTNRAVKDARLEWESKDGLLQRKEARVVPGDPQSFQVRMVIDETGQYRLAFNSTDGETYIDPARHTVTAIEDHPPQVELTQPGKDISLPINGLLRLEGKADDDIGVKGIVLRSHIDGGTRLQARPYRPERMRLADGGYPVHVDYSDSLDLATVKGEDGKSVALKAGMEIEYWLEASDACDYDRPHVSRSKHYKVKLTEPDTNAARQQQERDKAADEQKKHEQKQEQQRKEEEQKREQDRQEQKKKNEAEQGQAGSGKEGPRPDSKEPKGGDDPTRDQPREGGQQEPSDQSNEGKLTPEQEEKLKQLKDAADRNEGKNEQQQGNGGDKGEARPDQPQGPGEAKPDNNQGDGQKGEQGNAGQKSEGEGKEAGKQGAQGAGEEKKQGPQGGEQQQPSEGKGGGQSDPMNGKQGEAKPEGGQGQAGQQARGEDKGKGQPDKGNGQGAGTGQQQRAEGKPAGSPEQSQQAGQGKPEGKPGAEGAQTKAEPKDAGAEGGKAENRQALGEKKENGGQGQPCSKCEGKGAGKGSPEGQGTAKAGGGQGEKTPNGEGKPNPQGGQNAAAQGDAKPGNGGGGCGDRRPEDARAEDVAKLAKDLASGDEQTREDAARKLEDIMRQSRDAQAREGAREALEEMKKEGPGQPGNKPMGDPTQTGAKGDKTGGDTKPGKNGEPGAGDARTGGGGNSRENQAPGDRREGDPKGPKQTGDAKGPDRRPAGKEPGDGFTGRRTDTDRRMGDPGGHAGKPSTPEAHRAGVLQLEDIKKRVNKDVLQKAGMTEEDYRKFLEECEKALRSSKVPPRAETPSGPQPVTPLPSFGGKGGTSGEVKDDLGSDAKALPPPPYRDAWRKFTEQLSRPTDNKK